MKKHNGVFVDPDLPKGFYATENSQRSEKELKEWWGVAYIINQGKGAWVQYIVECLDGGSWDRPTQIGFTDDIDEAADIANNYTVASHPLENN